jgi:CBS domain-containing protein
VATVSGDASAAAPETPLHEIATLMEKNAIKRVPILENGKLVGIVSRANLIQVVATARKLLDIRSPIRPFAKIYCLT